MAGRMGITGARWGLEAAEAVLKLRAVIANGDFDRYWRCHLPREHERVHLASTVKASPYSESLAVAA